MVEQLKTDATVKGLIGAKIYPLLASQNVKAPFIVYTNVNDKDLTSLQGENYANKTRFQIDIYSKSYAKGKEILGAVKDALYQFEYIPHNFNARDGFEKETKLYRQLVEFNFIHKE